MNISLLLNQHEPVTIRTMHKLSSVNKITRRNCICKRKKTTDSLYWSQYEASIYKKQLQKVQITCASVEAHP